MPRQLSKMLADVITVLLKRINVPDDEIEAFTSMIHERRLQEMFNIVGYDVQETRRVSREEGRVEGREEILKITKMFLQKKTPSEISTALDVPEEKVNKILLESGLLDLAK